MIFNILLLGLLIVAVLATVLSHELLQSAISLAVTSVVLAILMFRLDSPLAAVFELSICAGLITVIFISAISLTNTEIPKTTTASKPAIGRRFLKLAVLPLLMLLVGAAFFFLHGNLNITLPTPELQRDVRTLLWSQRQLDLLGQIIIILAGVFGVVVLFKEKAKDE